MSTPYHFTPRVPGPPHPTPASTSAYSLPNPRAPRPPIHNPYDKFTQPEFDAWIGGITGALRNALGQEDEKPLVHSQIDETHKQNVGANDRYSSIGDDESGDELVDDSFAEFKARRATGKGKARDPREGPGLWKGISTLPIEIVSSDEEEEEEVELAIAPPDGEESEEEQDEEAAAEAEAESETEEYAWEMGPGSSQPLRSSEIRITSVSPQPEEEYEHEEAEFEQYENEEYEDDEEYDDQPRGSSPQIIDIVSDDEEEVQSKSKPSKLQGGELAYEDHGDAQEEEEEDLAYAEYSEEEEGVEIVPPQASGSRYYTSNDMMGHTQPEYEEHDEIIDDEDEIQEVQPKGFHQQPRRSSDEQDVPVEIPDPWEGPRTYAEDYYSGGEVRLSGDKQLDASHLGTEDDDDHFENKDDDYAQGGEIDDEIQPLSQDTSFPPEATSSSPERKRDVEIPDPWSGPRHYAQDFYSDGQVILPSSGKLDPNHLGPGDIEHVILDAEEEELEEEIEEEIQPLDADTSFPPQEQREEDLTDIPDPWMGPQTYAEDFYSGGDIRTLPGERIDPFLLHGTGDLDDGIDAFLTPGALSPNPSDERTSLNEEEEEEAEGSRGPSEHYVTATSRRNQPIPSHAEFISIDDSDEEPAQDANLSEEASLRFEETMYSSIYDFEGNEHESTTERVDEVDDEGNGEITPPPPETSVLNADSSENPTSDVGMDLTDEWNKGKIMTKNTSDAQHDHILSEGFQVDHSGRVPVNIHCESLDIVQPAELIEPESSLEFPIQTDKQIESSLPEGNSTPASATGILTPLSKGEDILVKSALPTGESATIVDEQSARMTFTGQLVESFRVEDGESDKHELQAEELPVTEADDKAAKIEEMNTAVDHLVSSLEDDATSTANAEQVEEAQENSIQWNGSTSIIHTEVDSADVANCQQLITPLSDKAWSVSLPPTEGNGKDETPSLPSELIAEYTVIEASEDVFVDEAAIGQVNQDIEIISAATASDIEEQGDFEGDTYSVEEAVTEGRLTEEPYDRAMSLSVVSVGTDEYESRATFSEQGISAFTTDHIPSPGISQQSTQHEAQLILQREPSAASVPAANDVEDSNDARPAASEVVFNTIAAEIEDMQDTLPTTLGQDKSPQFEPRSHSPTKLANHISDSGSLNTVPHSPPAYPPSVEEPFPVSTTVTYSLPRTVEQQSNPSGVEEGPNQSFNSPGPLISGETRDIVLSSINEAFFSSNLPNYFGGFFPAQHLTATNQESLSLLSREPSEPYVGINERTPNVCEEQVVSIPKVSFGPHVDERAADAEENPGVSLPTPPPKLSPKPHVDVEERTPNVEEQGVPASGPLPEMSSELRDDKSTNNIEDNSRQVASYTPPFEVPFEPLVIEKTMEVEGRGPANSTSPTAVSESHVDAKTIDDKEKYCEVTMTTTRPSTPVMLNRLPTAPALMFDAYPYNLSTPTSFSQKFASPAIFVHQNVGLDNSTSSTSTPQTQPKYPEDIAADAASGGGDWEDLEFQYPPEQTIIAEFKDVIPPLPIPQPAKVENEKLVGEVKATIPLLENSIEPPSNIEKSENVAKAGQDLEEVRFAGPSSSNLENRAANVVAPVSPSKADERADSIAQTSPAKTASSSKRTAKRKRDTSPGQTQTATKSAVGQKTKDRRSSKSDRKGKSRDLMAELPAPTSEDTIHVRPRPKDTSAQSSVNEASGKPADILPAYRLLQTSSRASSAAASDPSDKFAQSSPTAANKPNKPPPVQQLPQISLFHAHGKGRKQQSLSNFPPKLAKQVQSLKPSPVHASPTPKISEPSTQTILLVPSQPLITSEIPRLEIPTPNILPIASTSAVHPSETSPAHVTPLATSPAPITPVITSPTTRAETYIPLAATPPAAPVRTPSLPVTAAHTPSHQSKPVRSASMTSSPVTRSHCRYHRISLPKEEGGPRILFLVPGCSLNDKELMEDEEIEDHGDATVEDSHRMIKDLDSLNLHSDLIGILRQLVGLDILREQEVFYLPHPGEEVPRKNSLRKSMSEKSAIYRVPPDSSSYAGSPEYSGGYPCSPGSFKAVTSATGSRSPSIGGLRSFLDSEKGSSYAPSDRSDGEGPEAKRARPTPPEDRGIMGPPPSVQSKGKEKAKRSHKAKPKADGGGTEAGKSSRKPRKRGVKRSRTSEAHNAVEEGEPSTKKLKTHPTDPGQSPEKPPPS